jgi:hypothetical protein
LAAGKRQALADYVLSAGRTPPPRDRGEAHPDRVSHLRNVVTPLRSRQQRLVGRPQGELQFLSGNRMTREANAGMSKDNGKTTSNAAASLRGCRITARIRVLMARPERVLMRVGWACEDLMIDGIGTEGQVGRHDGDGYGRN